MHIQRCPVLPNPDKNVLDDIFTGIFISQDQKSELIQTFPMPAVKDIEGILIIIRYCTNEILIGRKLTQSS
jgi:hypothetical protein